MNLSCPATISFAAICGANYLTFLLFIQRITKKEKNNKIKIEAFFPVKWKVEYLLFTMVTHQDYYLKIVSLIADVPPQIVIVSTSHSFARVIMMLLRIVKTPWEKKKLKHPQNLSLKEVKSCYRDKLPVGLLALGYITPSTSPEGPLFEICPSLNGISAFIFTTTSILFLASTKWYLSTSIFTPQLKYVISIDWFTFAVFVLHGRIAKTEIHRSFPHSCFTISVVKVSPDYYGFKSSLGLTFPLL